MTENLNYEEILSTLILTGSVSTLIESIFVLLYEFKYMTFLSFPRKRYVFEFLNLTLFMHIRGFDILEIPKLCCFLS